jgi:TAG lipase / steryl ester hydrolase / phospholipase A2 / LPA acyltransferase
VLIATGRDVWKEDPVSPAYDYKLLGERLKQLNEARMAGDMKRVMFLLRISLTRNFSHAGNPEVCSLLLYCRANREQLYIHTNIGTKKLVEDYIVEVEEALQFLLRVESPVVSDAQKLDQLTCLRQVRPMLIYPNSRHMDGQLYFFQEGVRLV